MGRSRRVGVETALAVLALAVLTPTPSASERTLEFGAKGGLAIGAVAGFDTFFDPEDWGQNLPTLDEGIANRACPGGLWGLRALAAPRRGGRAALRSGRVQAGRDDHHRWRLRGDPGHHDDRELPGGPDPAPVRLHETETGSAFLSAGPSVGLKTGATFDMEASREAGPMPGTMKESVDVSGFVKDTNFSLVAGAGYTFRRGTLWLTLEARYALGLIDVMERIGRIIVEPDDDDYLLLDKAKPRTFLITLGVGRRPGGE
jgi:hypothetical protein